MDDGLISAAKLKKLFLEVPVLKANLLSVSKKAKTYPKKGKIDQRDRWLLKPI